MCLPVLSEFTPLKLPHPPPPSSLLPFSLSIPGSQKVQRQYYRHRCYAPAAPDREGKKTGCRARFAPCRESISWFEGHVQEHEAPACRRDKSCQSPTAPAAPRPSITCPSSAACACPPKQRLHRSSWGRADSNVTFKFGLGLNCVGLPNHDPLARPSVPGRPAAGPDHSGGRSVGRSHSHLRAAAGD